MSKTEIVEEYAHSCRLVREYVDGDADKYHYEGPMGRVKTFRDPQKAHLYADVQTVTGGFREEKTGERGVPPAVARAREDILMAYLVSTPSMGVTWVARAFELEEEEVETYIEVVQNQAAKQRGRP